MGITKNNLGRIAEIIKALKLTHGVTSIYSLSPQIKLDALCEVLQFTPAQLDSLLNEYSPARRTLQGHAFETVFEHLIEKSGHRVVSAGGDTNIDAEVNGITLQLKTPYQKGSYGTTVSYKTHKTHGAKSEAESMEYYAGNEDFPDILVGLVSYSPFRMLFLKRSEIPTHPKDPQRIPSPFSIKWDTHPGLNAFDRIGIHSEDVDIASLAAILPIKGKELLPRTADSLQLKSDFILNTILRESNFRLWDMNIRGFAREIVFLGYLRDNNIAVYTPTSVKSIRGDKADVALQKNSDGTYSFFQMKGVSINTCTFEGDASLVGVETQLTRGRVNDHPTQSRLYLESDFHYLIIGIDPYVAMQYNREMGTSRLPEWEFYVIPTSELERHASYSHRIKPLQRIPYKILQKYRIQDSWIALWVKEDRLL